MTCGAEHRLIRRKFNRTNAFRLLTAAASRYVESVHVGRHQREKMMRS